MVNQRDFGAPSDPQLYVADLHAYRTFKWGTLGPYLTGMVRPDRWAENHTASCYTWPRRENHAATPDPNCTCGIYAWYSAARNWPQDWSTGGYQIFGAVQVSGSCVLGSLGLRAERATVLAVTAPDGHDSLFRSAMREAYPNTRIYATKSELLDDFPQSDWKSLVGHACPGEYVEPEVVPQYYTSYRVDPTAGGVAAYWQQQQATWASTATNPGTFTPGPAPAVSDALAKALEVKRSANRGPYRVNFEKRAK